MISNDFTGTQLAITNLALCQTFNNSFQIARPHNISLIEKQYGQLSGRPEAFRRAYVANAVARLKPFASNNVRTALTLLIDTTTPAEDVARLSGLIKHGADSEHIADALEQSWSHTA